MAEELAKLIAEDNVEELSKILNSNEILRNNFNTFTTCEQTPFLHFAVQSQSKRVVEYLLSQPFVDKNICNSWDENIYHVICSIRGADQLFSIIERNVPHHLLLSKFPDYRHSNSHTSNVFKIACRKNNIFIVKRVHEILKSLKFDLLSILINKPLYFALFNEDIEVTKYVLSIDGIQLTSSIVYNVIGGLKFDVVVHLLNVYLCQSIPSYLHNQFHIFQFSKLQNDNKNNQNKEEINKFHHKILKRERDDHNDFINQYKRKVYHNLNNNNDNNTNNNNDENKSKIILKPTRLISKFFKSAKYLQPPSPSPINSSPSQTNINNNNKNATHNIYLTLVEENFKKLIDININGNRIWHGVCSNADINVVQLIFSLKGVQPEVLTALGYNSFLFACEISSNIKVIKTIHKLFPAFINSIFTRYDNNVQNAAFIVIRNTKLNSSDKLKILRYLYLNGIDIHIILEKLRYLVKFDSIYTVSKYLSFNYYSDRNINSNRIIMHYLKVISQDFDYLHNEHDDEAYRKPSFWKEIDRKNNGDEQSIRINEWKNRFHEHVLHHLSKMIQEWMLK